MPGKQNWQNDTNQRIIKRGAQKSGGRDEDERTKERNQLCDVAIVVESCRKLANHGHHVKRKREFRVKGDRPLISPSICVSIVEKEAGVGGAPFILRSTLERLFAKEACKQTDRVSSSTNLMIYFLLPTPVRWVESTPASVSGNADKSTRFPTNTQAACETVETINPCGSIPLDQAPQELYALIPVQLVRVRRTVRKCKVIC